MSVIYDQISLFRDILFAFVQSTGAFFYCSVLNCKFKDVYLLSRIIIVRQKMLY